jgi:hypothetical protein
MARVYADIRAHPRYLELEPGTRWALFISESGLSWTIKENNAHARSVWHALHTPGADPQNYFLPPGLSAAERLALEARYFPATPK